jgi:hypothetical protein
MRTVRESLLARDTSEATQQLQRQIADDLAVLIDQARQQSAAKKPGGRGSAGANGEPVPTPPSDSTHRVEPGAKEAAETADVKDVLRRFWGHLPDKMREQMQSSLSEQFLPKYERLIEQYYQRLAEDVPSRP